MLLSLKFLQTKPQLNNLNITYNSLYTVIKNRDEKETVDDHFEDNENDYINYEDFMSPNNSIRIKPQGTI